MSVPVIYFEHLQTLPSKIIHVPEINTIIIRFQSPNITVDKLISV